MQVAGPGQPRRCDKIAAGTLRKRTDDLQNRLARIFPHFAVLALAVIIVFQSSPALGQDAADGGPAAEPVRVFLDCDRCDFDYLRREIGFVSYVRERQSADVHILVTTQRTGGGGVEYIFKFIGLGRFLNIDDELKYVARETQTDDERRSGYANLLKLGLVRYVTSTAAADRLRLVYRSDPRSAPAGTAAVHDPWNFWSFRLRGSGTVSGEKSNKSRNLSTLVAANRTTDELKVNVNGSLNFHGNEFTLSDGTVFTDASHDHGLGGIVVKSLGNHWAVASRGRLGSTTFLNQKRAARIGGGVEYDVFPYSESSRRELTFQLTSNLNHFRYYEPTIYAKLSETAADAVFQTAFDVRQPWGSSGLSFEAATYFHDLARHRVAAAGSLDARLFKGFSLSIDGSASRINDQLYLKAGVASDEEILLRRRQLATTYRYRFSIGLSYTFGSIYNNVVNTRF